MMMMMRQNKRFRDFASFRLFFPPKTLLFLLFLYLFFFLFLFFSRASPLSSSSSSSSPSSSFASSSVTKNARKKTHAGTDRPMDRWTDGEGENQTKSVIDRDVYRKAWIHGPTDRSIRLRDARCDSMRLFFR